MGSTSQNNVTFDELYDSLWKYARWKASYDDNRGHWCLNKDDLYSEYLMVMYNCYLKYSDRPLEELMVICKSGMRNKFRSMLTKYFQTHRVAEKCTKELDADDTFDVPSDIDLAEPEESEVLADIMDNLCSTDTKVLDAILGNNERMAAVLELHRRRMSFCLNDKPIRISVHMIAQALCENESEIEKSFGRIREFMRERNKYKFFQVISNNELIWI